MPRVQPNSINPDGVPILIEMRGFTPGTSIFIPCINTSRAVKQLIDLCKLDKKDIHHKVCIENKIYGVRVWRVK